MIERGPTQIIRIHYPDQYPFSPQNWGQVSCEGMPAFVGRPMLICSLASSVTGEKRSLPKRFDHRAGLSPTLVAMATNGRGGSCRWMMHRGRARPGGAGGGSLPWVLCAWNNTSSWQGGEWIRGSTQPENTNHRVKKCEIKMYETWFVLYEALPWREGLWVEFMFRCSQKETGLTCMSHKQKWARPV